MSLFEDHKRKRRVVGYKPEDKWLYFRLPKGTSKKQAIAIDVKSNLGEMDYYKDKNYNL